MYANIKNQLVRVMGIRMLPLAMLALLLSGCTMNPRDSVALEAANGTGAAGAGLINATPAQAGVRLLTLSEVAKHNTKHDCWMVIDAKVLDLSSYTGHPGGDTYVPYCGTDATDAFNSEGGIGRNHSQSAFAMLDMYAIGALGQPQNNTAVARAGNGNGLGSEYDG
jgi:hypothetical protein